MPGIPGVPNPDEALPPHIEQVLAVESATHALSAALALQHAPCGIKRVGGHDGVRLRARTALQLILAVQFASLNRSLRTRTLDLLRELAVLYGDSLYSDDLDSAASKLLFSTLATRMKLKGKARHWMEVRDRFPKYLDALAARYVKEMEPHFRSGSGG